MDEPMKVSNLTEPEAKTYLHLGIIATGDGTRDRIYKRKQSNQLERGSCHNNVDLVSWFADQFSEDELTKMWKFRGSLIHGVCSVNPDGVLTVLDKDGSTHCYSPEDVRQMALSFWKVHFSHSVSMTVSVEER